MLFASGLSIPATTSDAPYPIKIKYTVMNMKLSIVRIFTFS